jgi:hypothetical protein
MGYLLQCPWEPWELLNGLHSFTQNSPRKRFHLSNAHYLVHIIYSIHMYKTTKYFAGCEGLIILNIGITDLNKNI